MADITFVTLISAEGHRFVLPKSAALGSGFIKNALESGFGESATGIITLEEQRSEIVEKVAEYLMYKERYSNSRDDPPDFQERVRPEIALELLMAADFLET
ncbi:transcription elongation factor B, polypeptide 1 [Pseudohyphozyma bogoriensis]|nr:transcription elongation factor B, polypeptide 1 [Pseudohyphozyma bogoriensis]